MPSAGGHKRRREKKKRRKAHFFFGSGGPPRPITKQIAPKKSNTKFIKENYTKEVCNGWMIPLTVQVIHKIRGAMVIIIGYAIQPKA